MRRAVIIVLLVLATTHCVLSLYYVNRSFLDLHSYAHGTEQEPFQRRFLMVPILRAAESSRLLHEVAARYGQNVPQTEPMSAAKLASLLISLALLNTFGIWTFRASLALSVRHEWLVWTLVIIILYASYAARYEQSLWYPYDIPHLVLFGLGTIFVLCDRPLPFVTIFVFDAPLRETSIFLLPFALLIRWRSKPWLAAFSAGSILWILSRILAYRIYPGVHRWNGLHWYNQIKPWHLPQVFSIVGFLLLPVWMGLRWLETLERRALYGATAMIILTFYFATWNETRAWSEWTVLIAILAAIELERSFAATNTAGFFESSERPHGLAPNEINWTGNGTQRRKGLMRGELPGQPTVDDRIEG